MRNPLAILARILIGSPLYAMGFLAGLVSTPLRAGFTAAEALVDGAVAARQDTKHHQCHSAHGLEAR